MQVQRPSGRKGFFFLSDVINTIVLFLSEAWKIFYLENRVKENSCLNYAQFLETKVLQLVCQIMPSAPLKIAPTFQVIKYHSGTPLDLPGHREYVPKFELSEIIYSAVTIWVLKAVVSLSYYPPFYTQKPGHILPAIPSFFLLSLGLHPKDLFSLHKCSPWSTQVYFFIQDK